MKKIITSDEADRFFCPLHFDAGCVGSKCMKWEDETERKQVNVDKVILHGDGSKRVRVETIEKDVPTGKGFCGL
jgi:hypothetical protein